MSTTTKEPSLKVKVLDSLNSINCDDWNALAVNAYPFLRYEFLHALEQHDCLGERYGWLPRHITLWNGRKLIAATPLYLKFNSYGEFVFDWAWADAYARQGMDYYPKLVSASPYTPATGPKLLLHPDAPKNSEETLIKAAVDLAQQSKSSSLHWLFPNKEQNQLLTQIGFMPRLGCQFHWHNNNYDSFTDFLSTFNAAKRKKVNRERRRVKEADITFKQLNGHSATDEDWRIFHHLYELTFDKRGGTPTLSLGFFKAIATSMPDSVLLVLALHEDEIVAAAFNLVGEHTLYGRHWGCFEDFHSLHFEACYYQGLDFCIKNKLKSFEPGAQGEHKISRGFLPTETWSTHWVADERFGQAIDNFLKHETEGMHDYIAELQQHSPYKDIKS